MTVQPDVFTHFFNVRLDLFDGPIDLLLHLVKVNELPIEKVSLAEVADQYFSCLEAMRAYDLEIAGEYLVIASTLLSIKSSMILDDPVELTVDEDGNLIDPHEELLRRLHEAEVYKEGALHLAARDYLGIDVFSPPSSMKKIQAAAVEYKDHDPLLLGQAFRELLSRAGNDEKYTITIDSVSIVERMMTVLSTLKEQGAVAFYKLIPDITSRMSIVGTFIALLELCKRQAIRVKQEETFQEIIIALTTEDFDAEALASEYDEGQLMPEEVIVNA